MIHIALRAESIHKKTFINEAHHRICGWKHPQIDHKPTSFLNFKCNIQKYSNGFRDIFHFWAFIQSVPCTCCFQFPYLTFRISRFIHMLMIIFLFPKSSTQLPKYLHDCQSQMKYISIFIRKRKFLQKLMTFCHSVPVLVYAVYRYIRKTLSWSKISGGATSTQDMNSTCTEIFWRKKKLDWIGSQVAKRKYLLGRYLFSGIRDPLSPGKKKKSYF